MGPNIGEGDDEGLEGHGFKIIMKPMFFFNNGMTAQLLLSSDEILRRFVFFDG